MSTLNLPNVLSQLNQMNSSAKVNFTNLVYVLKVDSIEWWA